MIGDGMKRFVLNLIDLASRFRGLPGLVFAGNGIPIS
jgi:hypothetical protein